MSGVVRGAYKAYKAESKSRVRQSGVPLSSIAKGALKVTRR